MLMNIKKNLIKATSGAQTGYPPSLTPALPSFLPAISGQSQNWQIQGKKHFKKKNLIFCWFSLHSNCFIFQSSRGD